jgi:hypothetical protein
VTSHSAHRPSSRTARVSASGGQREALGAAGRAGFAARGVVYVLIGVLAVRIAFGGGGAEADRQGALREVAAQPLGDVMLWALVVGFGCMAVWRAAGVLTAGGRRRKASEVVTDGARAVFYAAVCWGTAAYAAGSGGSSGSDQQSQDWTASALKLPFGRWLVALAGCALIAGGTVIAVQALRRTFLRKLDTGSMSPRTRTVVTALGMAGGAARGVVFAAVGVFVLVAAIRFDPDQAKGLDATLRSFAATPAGPWLLVAVAVGLILFGCFSFASARWRRT